MTLGYIFRPIRPFFCPVFPSRLQYNQELLDAKAGAE